MSSDSNLIAVRYVSALFDLATEGKEHDSIKKDMLAIKATLEASDELRKFFANPVVTRAKAEKSISAVLTAIKASDLTQKFFALLARQRRLALTPLIVGKYLAKLAESRGELSVQVISATPLDKKEADMLAEALAKSTKKKVELQLSQNPGLIGGLQIRIGSKMLDNSISGKLARMRIAMTKAA